MEQARPGNRVGLTTKDNSHIPFGLHLNIIIIMVFSRPINRAEESKGKTYFPRTMKPSLDFYQV
jgi:hypothetical protein